MKGIIRFIKRVFRQYEIGYEYWINIKDIKVDPEWRKTKIDKAKFRRKLRYWYLNGKFESRIILDKNFNLLDGYSSVIIAEIKNVKKVPVYFVD